MNQETINHCLCADWLSVFEKKTGLIFFFHPANGGKRNKKEAVILKRMGVKAGVADLWIITKQKPLIVELKIEKGSLRKEQLDAQHKLNNLGYVVHCIHSDSPLETLRQLKELVFRYCNIYPEEYSKYDYRECLPTWKHLWS